MEHHVEGLIVEGRQVAHIALHGSQRQPFAARHGAVLVQLPSDRSNTVTSAPAAQHRRLLAAGASQAQDAQATDRVQPAARQRSGVRRGGQITAASSRDDLGRHGPRPFAVLRGLLVPGCLVVGQQIQAGVVMVGGAVMKRTP